MQASVEALSRYPAPAFSLKAGYFLTDTSRAGMANTWLVPRRHLEDALEGTGGAGQPAGAVPFCAPANSCCIFDRRLWRPLGARRPQSSESSDCRYLQTHRILSPRVGDWTSFYGRACLSER